jgi:glycosyltransferase involved in cell wall biosynthesis
MPRKDCVLIVLMSLAAEGTPRLALELSREWIDAGVQPLIVVMQQTPDDLASDFAALGLTCIILDLPDRGYARYLALAYRIFAIAREHRPIAILSMPLGWHALIALGARMAGVNRIIAHVGNYPNTSARTAFRKFKLLVQLGRPFTDCLVCCSHYVRSGTVRHFGVRASETAVIYNGFPVAFGDSTRNTHQQSDAPFIIGMVARLEGHKDQPTLIGAARILRSRGRNVRIWLIGDGSRREEFESLIAAEDVDDTVQLLGMRKDIPDLVAKMHVFAFSTTKDEGLGIALIEAMAIGVPVVASDVGACREVLEDGRLGTLVPPGDALAMANAIDAIIADATFAETRAHLARTKVVQTFSMAEMARGYSELLGLPLPAKPEYAPIPERAA